MSTAKIKLLRTSNTPQKGKKIFKSSNRNIPRLSFRGEYQFRKKCK